MTRKEKIQKAIAAGYWTYLDHKRWCVGKGHSKDVVILSSGFPTKDSARAFMVSAWETEKKEG